MDVIQHLTFNIEYKSFQRNMLFLIGSIILTSYLTLSFKVVERFKIPNLQVIVFNHLTCIVVGSFVDGAFPITKSTFQQDWFPWACVMGSIFILLFNLIAYTAQKSGVAVASVSNKLSLVIPFIFSIYLYNDEATLLKIIGVIIALLAVLLTCLKRKSDNRLIKPTNNRLIILLPVLLFLGSGMLDTMIKFVEQEFLGESNKNAYLITAFAVAALLGILILLFLFLTGRQNFDRRSLLAGIAIGIPNYFSIWCLLRVLKDHADNSSAIIPINNMGIVLFSTVLAALLFKEKLSVINWIGILLSLGAIALIAYG